MNSRIKKHLAHTHSHILIEHGNPQHRLSGKSAKLPLHKKVLSVSVAKHSRHLTTSPSHSTRGLSPRQVDLQIPNPIVRKSNKSFAPIEAYAVSTHHGLYHLINEDKISIHLGRVAVFGVFDGYGGSLASDFLKERMVIEVLRQKRNDMENLLTEVFQHIDEQLLQTQLESDDKSGSSALLCLILNNLIYVANVGTSFAFGKSSKDGKIIKLSNQHSCENHAEYSRVTTAGARVFQTKVSLRSAPEKFVEGPLRIHPYGLTVTRTMGYFPAKVKPPEGKRYDTASAIISKPELRYMKVEQLDWACLCSQGLLNTLTPSYVLQIIDSLNPEYLSPHDYLERCVQQVMKAALKRGCRQNATIILIQFTKPSVPQPSKQVAQIIEKKISLRYIGGRSTVHMEK